MLLSIFSFGQSFRQATEQIESVLKAERERWAKEKAESQKALHAAQTELSRLRAETRKQSALRTLSNVPVSGHEPENERSTWSHAKVRNLELPVFAL